MPPVGPALYAITIAALLGASGPASARTPEAQLRWSQRLSALSGETAAPTQRPIHTVEALRFSPDGRWIAAAVGHSTELAPGKPDELVILGADGDAKRAVVFPLSNPVVASEASPAIYWGPSSDHILVPTRGGGTIIRAADGATCEIRDVWLVGGFVDAAHVIGATHVSPARAGSYTINRTAVSVFGLDCRLASEWQFRGRIDWIEAYSPRRIAALLPDQSNARIVGAETGDLLTRLPEFSGGAYLRFGALGKAVCVGCYPATGPFACYSATTGQEIARHKSLKGGAPFDVSLDGSLVLASDGVLHYNAFTERTRDEWKRWVVWDFLSGRDVAVLKYRTQRRRSTDRKTDEVPFAAAISPDGRFFAIGGDDQVFLYAIPR